MNKLWHETKWVIATVLGSALFALGFAVFLQPNGMNSGGISGLAMVIVELLGVGSVGVISIVMNLPLFLLGGIKIGKRFFFGSLLGMILSSVLGFSSIGEGLAIELPEFVKNIVIFASVVTAGEVYKKIKKKKISPILLILLSGVMGLILFSF